MGNQGLNCNIPPRVGNTGQNCNIPSGGGSGLKLSMPNLPLLNLTFGKYSIHPLTREIGHKWPWTQSGMTGGSRLPLSLSQLVLVPSSWELLVLCELMSHRWDCIQLHEAGYTGFTKQVYPATWSLCTQLHPKWSRTQSSLWKNSTTEASHYLIGSNWVSSLLFESAA